MGNVGLVAAFFGAGAAASWGVSDFLAARALKSLGPLHVAFMVNVIAATLFTAVFFLLLGPHRWTSWNGAFCAISGGILYAAGMVSFFKGLQLGPVTAVSPLSSVYPFVTAFVGVAAFGASLSLIQALGVVVVVSGVAAAAGLAESKEKSIGSTRRRKLGPGPARAIAAAVCWGVGFSLVGQAAAKIGWETTTALELAAAAAVFTLLLGSVAVPTLPLSRPALSLALNRFVVGSAIIQLAGTLSFNFGLTWDRNAGAIVSAVSATYPLVTVVLAIKHFRERIRVIPLVGAVAAIVGVMVLALG